MVKTANTNAADVRRGVPSMTTRDRMKNALGDLEISEVSDLLAQRGVKTSHGTLHALRSGTVETVELHLATSIRELADTHTPPVDDAVAYLATNEGADFIEACRGPAKYRGRRSL